MLENILWARRHVAWSLLRLLAAFRGLVARPSCGRARRVVTAHALAVLAAALLSSVAHANDPYFAEPKQYTMAPKGVNMQTGRFNYTATDLSVGDLSLVRTWGDQPLYSYPGSRSLGLIKSFDRYDHGWGFTLNQGTRGITRGSSSGVKVYVDGGVFEFGEVSNGALVPIGRGAAGTYLRYSGANLLFTNRHGDLFTFFVHAAVSQGGLPGTLTQLLQSTKRADGTVISYTYRSTGQLQEARSSRGYAIHFDYNANNNVSRVCGVNLAVTYVDPTTPCAVGGLSVSYGYDTSAQNLTSVTDIGAGVVQITYQMFGSDMAYAPTCITLVNSATCQITNTYAISVTQCCASPEQVVQQVTATGDTFTFHFEPPPNPVDQPVVPGQPRWSYAEASGPGFGMALWFDRGRLIDYCGPEGCFNYKYTSAVTMIPYNLSQITFEFMDTLPEVVTPTGGDLFGPPLGSRAYNLYDPRTNLMYQSKWPFGAPDPTGMYTSTDPNVRRCCITSGLIQDPAGSVSVGASFPATVYSSGYPIGCLGGEPDAKLCDKPTLRIDEKSNQTDYTYDPNHGGLRTETRPAVNGIRPQTRYTYLQRSAWIKNAAGSYVQSATPVWLVASKSFCKTGAAATSGVGCAIAGDEVVTTYDYGPDSGPNNLLLRGVVEDANGLALRTCYSYDWQGNKISETKPRAGLTSCP